MTNLFNENYPYICCYSYVYGDKINTTDKTDIRRIWGSWRNVSEFADYVRQFMGHNRSKTKENEFFIAGCAFDIDMALDIRTIGAGSFVVVGFIEADGINYSCWEFAEGKNHAMYIWDKLSENSPRFIFNLKDDLFAEAHKKNLNHEKRMKEHLNKTIRFDGEDVLIIDANELFKIQDFCNDENTELPREPFFSYPSDNYRADEQYPDFDGMSSLTYCAENIAYQKANEIWHQHPAERNQIFEKGYFANFKHDMLFRTVTTTFDDVYCHVYDLNEREVGGIELLTGEIAIVALSDVQRYNPKLYEEVSKSANWTYIIRNFSGEIRIEDTDDGIRIFGLDKYIKSKDGNILI